MRINFSGVLSVDIRDFEEVSFDDAVEAHLDFAQRIGTVVAELVQEARETEKSRLDRLLTLCHTGQ